MPEKIHAPLDAVETPRTKNTNPFVWTRSLGKRQALAQLDRRGSTPAQPAARLPRGLMLHHAVSISLDALFHGVLPTAAVATVPIRDHCRIRGRGAHQVKDAIIGVLEPGAGDTGAQEAGVRDDDDDLLRARVQAGQCVLRAPQHRVPRVVVARARSRLLIRVDRVYGREVHAREFRCEFERGCAYIAVVEGVLCEASVSQVCPPFFKGGSWGG